MGEDHYQLETISEVTLHYCQNKNPSYEEMRQNNNYLNTYRLSFEYTYDCAIIQKLVDGKWEFLTDEAEEAILNRHFLNEILYKALHVLINVPVV